MQISTKHLNFSARALKFIPKINVEITIKQIDELLIIYQEEEVSFDSAVETDATQTKPAGAG